MSAAFPLFKWFRTARGMTGVLIVAVTSFVLAGYIAHIYISTPPPTYRPDFGKSQWITPQSAQAAAYFRKEIYVPEKPRHAWMLATAPDTFNLYVNNHMISAAGSNGSTGRLIPGAPTALVDITPYLNIGTNTVAVYVMASTYKYPACVRLRGQVDYDMRSQDILSDPSWRASSFPGILNNLIAWTDPTVDDTQWPLAKAMKFSDEQFVQPVPVPPWLFEEPLRADWIASLSPMPQRMNFSTEFAAPLGEHDGWMQIATFGKHRISINGHPIADSTEQSTVVDTPQDSSVDFYWIQPWLKPGRNVINVRVDDPRETPSLLAQISYQDIRDQAVHIISNSSWTTEGHDNKVNKAIDLGIFNDTGPFISTPSLQSAPSLYLASEYTNQFIAEIFVTLLLGTVFIFLHLGMAEYLLKRGMPTPSQALTLDALLHLPILLGVGVLQLLYYDIHFRQQFSQSPVWLWLMLLVWLGLRCVALFQLKNVKEERVWTGSLWFESEVAQGFTLLLAAITFLAFVLRVYSINLFSLDQDEILINFCAQGIWERGYPSVDNHGLVLRLTTYELLPYPMALSALLFGWHGWSMRIPAMLFGTFTAWNIGRMGRELFSPFVGLLTAFCYAIIPWNVYFAAHCIHPQQTQFFMLLCFWSFWRANQQLGFIDRRQFYKTCLFFVCGYLSWEGSAFVLPALAVSLIFLHPGKFNYLRQFHVYAGIFVVITVVVAQLAYRSTKAEPYRAIGFGLSNLSPRAVFLDQTGTTDFYMSGIMLEQCHIVLGLCLLLGFFFIAHNRPLRYIVLLFATLLFGYSNFLPVYTNRYFYFYQSLLILGGCASLCTFAKTLIDLARDQPIRLARHVACWSSAVAVALLISVSGNLGFRVMNISPQQEDTSTRYGLYWQEARPACEYIASHIRPGDFVAGNFNYSYYYFNGKWVDFTVNQYLDQLSVFTINKDGYGDYENIYVRVKSFLNERDFETAFSQCKRLWYVADISPTLGPDFVTSINGFVAHRSRIVYSGYNVNLYLSEGMATKAGEGMPDTGLPASALPKYTPATAATTNMTEETTQQN